MTFDELLRGNSFTFEVTQQDISEATKRNALGCPLAKAINRTLGLEPGSTSVSHTRVHTIRVPRFDSTVPYESIEFRHTPESTEFINTFDTDGQVNPATFTLERTYE